MAHTLKEKGHEVYILFEKDFYVTNKMGLDIKVYNFESALKEESFYLSHFTLKNEQNLILQEGDTIHMRIDPPFDTRYLRYLWMLRHFKAHGVKVSNDPDGILLFNEKMAAYEDESALPTYVGKANDSAKTFLEKLKSNNIEDVILKPLDLYQGIGVSKHSLSDLQKVFNSFAENIESWKGPGVIQPFMEEVAKGEVRSIYYKNKEIGSIVKIPLKGDFLANIARGASFESTTLNEVQKKSCDKISKNLSQYGIDLIAFDILGNAVNEVNITCPGLLVEVSEALGKNLTEHFC